MWYWTAAVILVVFNGCSVLANLVMLPGNWMMLAGLIVFVVVTPGSRGPDGMSIVVVAAMVIIAEVIEMVSGSARAARRGASRRAVVLSLVLSIVGSIAGAFLIPIPVIGSAIGAVAGAAAGAFGGAWLGEAWSGSDSAKRSEIGRAAMSGRMIGLLAKVSIGVAIFVFQIVSLGR